MIILSFRWVERVIIGKRNGNRVSATVQPSKSSGAKSVVIAYVGLPLERSGAGKGFPANGTVKGSVWCII